MLSLNTDYLMSMLFYFYFTFNLVTKAVDTGRLFKLTLLFHFAYIYNTLGNHFNQLIYFLKNMIIMIRLF